MDDPSTVVTPSPPQGAAPRRVLVTGGAGFIGSHVVSHLLLTCSQVRVLDDFSTGRIENLAEAMRRGLTASDVFRGDVRTAQAAEMIGRWRPDVVVHLAGQSSLPAARRSPLFDADVNILGTVNIADACVRGGVRLLVHAASSAVYGEPGPDSLPLGEDHPLAATNPYGISKAVGVHYLDWYRREHGLTYTALAFGNVYGPPPVHGGASVVALLTEALLDGRLPTIHGDGEQTRDFVHVVDVAAAVVRACQCPGAGLVNIATGRQTSINDLYRVARTVLGVEAEAHHVPHPHPLEVRRMALDTSKAMTHLGWHSTIGLTEGVRLTVEEARRRRFGYTAPEAATSGAVGGCRPLTSCQLARQPPP
ncbi:NAD-dependent epimerase/dehydratase family protein [Micromonospora sp. HNM0581]|uniref:NAD-dependent epimerase/dehydratase family protein n=1 Tax=Micromonospora sp. HNM0581 TaxID=2716341 RepID=UPI00146B5566|nr:GDP-mannose 4,6-dehydratase [Micromonospora sp. HNM0581]NLU78547.1 NAD-dependent epimerase/dehydratase family protein [Micromonospora sp. HNM0581]